jgi:uroporphyrinogen-III synthase
MAKADKTKKLKKTVKKNTVKNKVVKQKGKSPSKKTIKAKAIKKKDPIKKITKKPTIKKVVEKPKLTKDVVKKVTEKLKVIKPVIKKVVEKNIENPITNKPVKEKKPIKKQQAIPPQFVEADKNYLQAKVKTMLISQPKPENDKSPFVELARAHNIKINFRQFIQIDPVNAKDFRTQRINLIEHHAIILTSRIAIDHYFRMCNEMRYTVPETTKYFCLSESIALYLQKYVQYRKRKIFYGQNTFNDLVDVIKKHNEEKFLLPVSDVHREKIVDLLDDLEINYSKAIFYKTVCADLSDFGGTLDYDVLVFFTPMGISSLIKNFPKFKQGEIRIAAFGQATCDAVRKNKLRLDIAAPSKESPSMAGALEKYIKEVNKR